MKKTKNISRLPSGKIILDEREKRVYMYDLIGADIDLLMANPLPVNSVNLEDGLPPQLKGRPLPRKGLYLPDAFKDIMLQFAHHTVKTMRLQDGTNLAATMQDAMRKTRLLRSESPTRNAQ